MSAATRPLAQTQRRIIGRATLADIGAQVDLIAKATDLPTGRPFYVVQSSPRLPPFGVRPEEVTDVVYAQPVGD